MRKYLQLLEDVYQNGEIRTDRTGTGTTGIFGAQMRLDLENGFPLLTTKKMSFKIVVAELLWMLSGSTNARPLQEQGVHIWDAWADENGELGPIYGQQWRNWRGAEPDRWDDNDPVDQIANLIEGLKNNPDSRRHLVTAWNPTQVPYMALPPCHFAFQCHVGDLAGNPRLSLHVNMRSADTFLGVPYNIAFYALLTHILASICGYRPGDLVVTFGDLHIYSNHTQQVEEQLLRNPRPLPKLKIEWPVTSIDGLCPQNFTLEGYDPHPAIKAPVAV